MRYIKKFSAAALAGRANVALTAGGFETRAGFCLRWVRQVVQSCGGADAWPIEQGLDAKEAFEAFKALGLAVPLENGSRVGDLLFKIGPDSGRHGHVGIRLMGNVVAENSSAHVGGKDRDARGIRSLSG